LRLVCVSDTHNDLDSVKIPDGDVLIHAGDLTMMGTPGETAAELIKLARLPHKTKILIAGNHDFLPERDPVLFRALVQDAGVIYLQDTCHTVDGVTFFGSPWTPELQRWAFYYPRIRATERWQNMPHVDVVITHAPPLGYGDLLDDGVRRVGCAGLLSAIIDTKPKYHIFGHIHCSRGTYKGVDTTFINASCMGEDYNVCGDGIVIDM
jgi:Icc-related predicted phosphoesterase